MAQASVRWTASRYWLTSVRAVRPLATIHQPTAPCSPPRTKMPGEPRREAAADPACRPEPDQRERGNATPMKPAEEAVRPFPPEDRLEIRQAHALVDQLVFGNLLILGEFLLPLGFAQRRNDAVDRLPFGDRKAGIGQPGRSADQNHQHDQQGNPVQPPAHRRQAARWLLSSDFRRGGDTVAMLVLPKPSI